MAFRKFNSFRNFWKHFQEISGPFAAVSKFSKVLVEWKAPRDFGRVLKIENNFKSHYFANNQILGVISA